MRIKAVQLAWFRGAADAVSLEAGGKSIVVYGANGSGKSSFVDAVEFALNDGRIGHFSHEYSGKKQEKGIPNTHKPADRTSELTIRLMDGSEYKAHIQESGSHSTPGSSPTIANWSYRRTVLRQNEVAEFIQDTKGDKYSALLPLLGLQQMEVAADNLRRIAKAVTDESSLQTTKASLKQAQADRAATFGTQDDAQVRHMVIDLHAKYCGSGPEVGDLSALCEQLEAELQARITSLSGDQARQLALLAISELDLKGKIVNIQTASMELAGVVEPLIAEKLRVLQSASSFVEKLTDGDDVCCPACGQPVLLADFQAHVKAESDRLGDIRAIFNQRQTAIRGLCDTVRDLKDHLGRSNVKSWRDELAASPLAENLAFLDAVDPMVLELACTKDTLKTLEDVLLPLIEAAVFMSKAAPPDALELNTAKGVVFAAKNTIAGKGLACEVEQTGALISFIASLEQGVRAEIRKRSQAVISEISEDIEMMWAVLHPDRAIDGVRLYLPDATDKAIDIGLKFHGLDQESPRLTLSEGYRNSLGLCIFLAMAKRDGDKDTPLFLDDVVVSLDRSHRGMIVELLRKEFSGRQVIILTHDRDWYAELRLQLDDAAWSFQTLLPYETPDIGIRWSHKTTTFDDARAQVKTRPDLAANDVRKIMDVELALLAQRLEIRMPYLRGDSNDKRMAHDFLERVIADGRKCFQRRAGTTYLPNDDALAAWEEANALLVTWANRGSHTFDVVASEAIKLLDACETALGFFKCSSCQKGVWFANAQGTEWVQCQCGELRWRYGKG